MANVVIIGAAGRMGQALLRSAQDIEDLTVVGAVEIAGHPGLGKDAGEGSGLETGVVLTDDLSSALQKADVTIDFSLHDSVPGHAKIASENGRAIVIGTTGLSEAEIFEVDRAADKVPVVWAPNMSLGVNLLFSVLKRASATLGEDYQIEIDETHHIHKKDAPSGTALMLGEKVADGLGEDLKDIMVHDEGGKQPGAQDGKIVIHSHREGEVMGDHTVSFGNEYEKIEFTHHAWSREALARGALRAAQWVITQRPRLYDMQDVLGLS